MSASFTPKPWIWLGEDYRGGWGWQLLIGPSGEGILCGEENGRPFRGLRAYTAIDPMLCGTGMMASAGSAPRVHVRRDDANLIAAAPELYEVASALVASRIMDAEGKPKAWALSELDSALAAARAALRKARGES